MLYLTARRGGPRSPPTTAPHTQIPVGKFEQNCFALFSIVFSFFFFVDSYHEYTSQFLIHVWIVTILSLATFIKFYYLYKAALLVVMFLLYSVLIYTLMNWTSGM